MSEPLTPPDCDLRDFAFMKMDVMRLLDSDLFALSTGDEFKAALALWCKSWMQIPAASLPDDDRVLAHLSGAGSKWKKLRPMALRGWVKCSDGRLYHPVVAEKALDAWETRKEYAEKRDADRERLRKWRDMKRAKNDPEAVTETQVKRVSKTLRNADETRTKRLREGEGEGEYSVSKDTGTATFLDFPQNDPKRHFWESAKAYLGPAKGGMVGKWVRDYGQDETAKAVTAAQVHGAVDPVPYIEKMLRGGKRAGADVTDDGWELPIC